MRYQSYKHTEELGKKFSRCGTHTARIASEKKEVTALQKKKLKNIPPPS